jgi:hypothetical protein
LKMMDTMVSISVISFTGKLDDWLAIVRFCWDMKSPHLMLKSPQKQLEKDKYTKAWELNDLAYEETCLCID